MPWTEAWEEEKNEGGKHELHEHVHAGRKQREVEVEVVGREHPFVINGDGEGEYVPGDKSGQLCSCAFFICVAVFVSA